MNECARRYLALAPSEHHEPEGDDWPGFRPETDAELHARVDRAAAGDRMPDVEVEGTAVRTRDAAEAG